MNVKALTLAGVAVGVATATTVILNLVAPIHHETGGHAEGVTVEQVFSGALSESPLSPIASANAADSESAPAAAEPAMSEAPASEAAAAPKAVQAAAVVAGSCAATAPPSGAVMAAAPAPAAPVEVAQADIPATPEASAPETGGVDVPSAPAEPAPAAAAPSTPIQGAGSCSAAVPSGDARVVVTAAGMPGDAPAAAPAAESAPAMESSPAPAPEPVGAVTPAPEMAAAEAPKPKAAAKPRKPKAPEIVKKAWWPAKEAGKLNLTYAGEASFTKAVALLFDGAFETPDSANQNIVVKNKAGKVVKGTWFVSPNKQMLLFNVQPGLYTVEVGAGLTDKGNRTISTASKGPVYVP